MSKKDFIALADALFNTKPASGEVEKSQQWHRTLNAITRVCIDMNPRFSLARFEHRACTGHNLTTKCEATQTGCSREGK